MARTGRPWFEELTATPLIERAVRELRSAIPANLPPGAIGIRLTCHSDPYSTADSYSAEIVYNKPRAHGGTIEISHTQQAAAWLVVSVVAYQRGHMEAAYAQVAANGDIYITPKLRAAQARFTEDMRRKLKIETNGSLGLEGLDGTVIVYR